MAAKKKKARNRARGLGTRKGRKRVEFPKKSPEPSTVPREELLPTADHVTVEVRRTAVANLLERGVIVQRMIVASLAARGITATQATVSKDIAAIRHEWKEARIEDYELARDLVRNACLATLREAWEGWTASKSDTVTTRRLVTRKANAEDGAIESVPVMVERKTSSGNPEFITRMQNAIDELCRIDGLHAKIKLDLDPDGGLAELALLMGVGAGELPDRLGK